MDSYQPPLRWSDAALRARAAMTRQAEGSGTVYWGDAVREVLRLPVGESALSRCLHDPSLCPNIVGLLYGQVNTRSAGGFAEHHFDAAVEAAARACNATVIREYHLASVLESAGQQAVLLGISRPAEVTASVREIELGPGFDRPYIDGRRHGLLDTNIVAHCRDLRDIKWLEEVGSSVVVLWAGMSLLNELDRLTYAPRAQRVFDRVKRFRGWLHTNFEDARSAAGAGVRDGVTLRMSSEGSLSGIGDNDHLDTAQLLREQGVPIHVVTQDLLMRLRARTIGLDVHVISERWKLPPEIGKLGRAAQQTAGEA